MFVADVLWCLVCWVFSACTGHWSQSKKNSYDQCRYSRYCREWQQEERNYLVHPLHTAGHNYFESTTRTLNTYS